MLDRIGVAFLSVTLIHKQIKCSAKKVSESLLAEGRMQLVWTKV